MYNVFRVSFMKESPAPDETTVSAIPLNDEYNTTINPSKMAEKNTLVGMEGPYTESKSSNEQGSDSDATTFIPVVTYASIDRYSHR